MICPSCNKFAANSTDQEPEIELQCESGHVTGTVRIVLTSECCGEELKEANFDVDVDLEEEILDAIVAKVTEAKEKIKREDIDLSDQTKRKVIVNGKLEEKVTSFEIEDETGEVSDRSVTQKTRIIKRGPHKGETKTTPIPYRYQRRFYGAAVNFTVKVEFPYKKKLYEVEVHHDWKDEVQASGMDELT